MNANIEDFLYWDSWFSTYKTKPGGRYYTFKSAIGLFLQNQGKLIVETGCVREPEDWGAGYSTYVFGQVCQKYNRQLITIDNVPEHLDMCKNITKDFKDFITYEFSDSIKFLQGFTRPIDLLYLDSMDCPLDESKTKDALASQKHALKELLAIYKNLHAGSIVMVDDNDWKHGGKSALVKRYLLENDWKVILDERHSLWIK